MNIRNLFTDDNAVSPVIGVILMVAITVILAAVIGAFVLDLGGSQESAPQASWSFDYDAGSDGAYDSSADDSVTISHNGGDDIDNSTLSYSIGGTSMGGSSLSPSQTVGSWSAGKSITIDEDGTNDVIQSGDSVQIIWESSSGDSSSVIGEGEVP